MNIKYIFLLFSISSISFFHLNSFQKKEPYLLAYFSPDDNIKHELIELIKKENKKILIASFRFTDKDITKELINAYSRGVFIEIVSDKGCLGFAYSKMLLLHNIGIPIYVFPPFTEKYMEYNLSQVEESSREVQKVIATALMHHKFFLFEEQEILFTGSFNFTLAANNYNQENVLIVHNKFIFEKYLKQFSLLKNRSSRIKN